MLCEKDNSSRIAFCKDDQSGRRKKEAKKQAERQTTGSKAPQLCREIIRRAKKDRELCIQSLFKEVEEARLYNKTHLVYKVIRRIAARYAPQTL